MLTGDMDRFCRASDSFPKKALSLTVQTVGRLTDATSADLVGQNQDARK